MNLTLISIHLDGPDGFVEGWVLVYKVEKQHAITVGKSAVWKIGN
jgi:hypothetical protein